jgi:hypothetical protein
MTTTQQRRRRHLLLLFLSYPPPLDTARIEVQRAFSLKMNRLSLLLFLVVNAGTSEGLAASKIPKTKTVSLSVSSRRHVLLESTWATLLGTAVVSFGFHAPPANALENVDQFLKTGMVSQPMGVSGQVSGCGNGE